MDESDHLTLVNAGDEEVVTYKGYLVLVARKLPFIDWWPTRGQSVAQAFFSGFSPPLLLPLSFPFPPPLLLPLKSRRREGVRGAPQGEKKEGVGERYRYRTHAGTQGAREQY